MNYFGHSAIASEHHPSHQPFVLGSMLPDLAGMLHIPCPVPRGELLRAGLEFHVATDAVFHRSNTFNTLNMEAMGALRRKGLSKGPVRAIAHVATEMLLDCVLIEEDVYLRSYLAALTAASEASGFLQFRHPQDQERFLGLTTHLRQQGPSVHGSDPMSITRRLERALAGHPRLEPSRTELESIQDWISHHEARVRDTAKALLHELRLGLALSPRSPLG